MTLPVPQAALAQLLKEAEQQQVAAGCLHDGYDECMSDMEKLAAWLAARGVVVLDAWINGLTDEQWNKAWEAECGASGPNRIVLVPNTDTVRVALKRLAEAPSGATGT